MAKKTLVNTETEQSVQAFIEAIPNAVRKEDAKMLLGVMKEISGMEPKIWGRNMVAFGKYKYQRKNGDEFEWFNAGFSPAKAHMTVYLMLDLKTEELLEKLGPHKNGSGCLYIKKLENIDMGVLRQLIAKSGNWDLK